jgi:hypothetical protein
LLSFLCTTSKWFFVHVANVVSCVLRGDRFMKRQGNFRSRWVLECCCLWRRVNYLAGLIISSMVNDSAKDLTWFIY